MKFKLILIVFSAAFISCKENISTKDQASNPEISAPKPIEEKKTEKTKISSELKDYWYNGTAEISSYSLQQVRYGELRDGNAVMIFVTEPFNIEKQVKADRPKKQDISVLKLNSTKKFNTGVYPYSIMNSTFYPIANNQHAIKITNSVQEWCGHVFMQLNNRKTFDIHSYSYFESEGDQDISLAKTILENELYNKLRIAPNTLPTGNLNIIPDFSYLRLAHKETKPYTCIASLKQDDTVSIYTLEYPDLNRTLSITFTSNFPYIIQGWEENYNSGFGPNAKQMTTKATLKKTMNIPYWSKNSNSDEILRNELMLD